MMHPRLPHGHVVIPKAARNLQFTFACPWVFSLVAQGARRSTAGPWGFFVAKPALSF